MLYENYQKKLKRIATIISLVVKSVPIILISIAVLIVIALSLVIAKGSVGSVNCPDELVYGEQIECKAFGMLTDVTYEYCKVGTDEWTTEVPWEQGEYMIRAVGSTAFGGKRYSEPKTIIISAKEIEVFVAEDSIIYGETPTPSGTILPGESITCDSFTFADVTAIQTDVTPDMSSVKIFNESGKDITHCYSLVPVTKSINILQRPISMTVEDYTAIYNGQECTFNKYQITEGTLKDGDVMSGSFASITNVGSVENMPAFKVLNADGNDVTHLYAMSITSGTITVDLRPLIVTTEGFESTYNGAEQYLEEYFIDGETTLADGHKLVNLTYGKFTNAGDYTNAMSFKILDANDKDVSDNYSITVVEGAVKINKKTVTITTPTDSWMYDGVVHKNVQDLVAEGLVEGQQVYVLPGYAAILDAGTMENKIEVKIVNETEGLNDIYFDSLPIDPGAVLDWDILDWETDVPEDGTYDEENKDIYFDDEVEMIEDYTANYDIVYVYGTLEVTKRPVTVKPEDVKKVYDGKVLAPEKIVLAESSANEFVAGEAVFGSMSGELLVVGHESSSVLIEAVTIISTDAGGAQRDVTENYEISTEKGNIDVSVRDLVISTKTETWMYDGNPHSSLELAEGFVPDLAEGDVLTIVAGPSITNVIEGATVNEFTEITIKNGDDDRYSNYNISYDSGTISVYPRTITVRAQSKESVYNGKKQYFPGFEVVGGDGLAEGQALAIDKSTEFEDAIPEGADNQILEFRIYYIDDPEQKDVKYDNYEWTLESGFVQIGKRFVTVHTDSYEWTYDGRAHSGLVDEEGRSTVIAGEASGAVREGELANGEGDIAEGQYFEVDSFVSVTDYQEVSPENRVVIKIYADVDGVKTDKTYNYEISEASTYGTLTINKRPYAVIAEGKTWTYDGLDHDHINSDEYPDAVKVINLVEDEEHVHEFKIVDYAKVRNYTATPVPNLVSVEIYEIVDGVEVDKSHNYYLLSEDPTDDSVHVSVYGDLIVEKRVIKVQTQEELKAVYNSEIQNFMGFTVLGDFGAGSVASGQVFEVIRSTDFEDVMFDADGNVISSVNEILDFIIYYEDDSEKTDVAAENYIVEWDNKLVMINLRDVTVTTFQNKWTYDGQEHSCKLHEQDEYGNILMEIGALAGADQYEIFSCSTVTDYTPTPVENAVKLTVFKIGEDGERIDKTANYNFVESFGTLTVDKRPITITSETNHDTVYDGKTHTFTNYTVDGWGLVEGHSVKVETSTEIKYVTDGTKDNVLTYSVIVIVEEKEVDKTVNYEITPISGKISLQKRTVIVKTGSKTHTYDATDITCTEWTYSESSIYEFVDTYTVTESTKVKNVNRATANDAVGFYDNVFTDFTITDAENVDRAGNYTVLYDDECGTITIMPRPIEITSLSAEKEYDAEELTKKEHKITEGSLVSDHKIVNSYSASILNAGEVDNEFTTVIEGAEGDVTYNYSVVRESGTLKITPVPIYLEIDTVSVKYDGKHYGVDLYFGDQRADIMVSSATYPRTISTPDDSISCAEVIALADQIVCDVTKTVNGKTITVDKQNYRVTVSGHNATADAVSISYRKITIQVKDKDKVYNGQELTCNEYYFSKGDGLADGHSIIEISFTGSVIGNADDIVRVDNEVEPGSIVIKDAEGNDVTEYYIITTKKGSLTVYPTEESLKNNQ